MPNMPKPIKDRKDNIVSLQSSYLKKEIIFVNVSHTKNRYIYHYCFEVCSWEFVYIHMLFCTVFIFLLKKHWKN